MQRFSLPDAKRNSYVELAAAAPPGPERGGVGREALDEPVAHGVGGLEADMAAPRAFAQDVSDGLDRAAALGSAEARDVSLEGDYEVLGVHAAPIVSVYGANDMAPWRHRYVNPGLAEHSENACQEFSLRHFAAIGTRSNIE